MSLTDARRYDAWFDSDWGAYAYAVEEAAVLAAADPLDGAEVLEIGCGTGRFTTALETAGAGVVGLDMDADMLAVAHTRVRGLLVQGDAQRLPFADHTFTLVVSVATTEFLVDVEGALAEALRVLRPDGRLVIGALNPRSPWGLAHRRRHARHPAWTEACLRSPRALRRRLPADVGVQRRAALYAPGAIPLLDRLGPLLERAGRLAPDLGAFQVLTIEPERAPT